MQKNGICIGSCVAPVLCNLFLAGIDKSLAGAFDGNRILKTFRYVDDFLIVLRKHSSLTYPQIVEEVLADFKNHAECLGFTCELPKGNSLQFLDIDITLTKYCPRARKELLPFDSTHSKTVKRAIVTMCLESSLKKSCNHKGQESFDGQIRKLKEAGFASSVFEFCHRSFTEKDEKRTKKTKR